MGTPAGMRHVSFHLETGDKVFVVSRCDPHFAGKSGVRCERQQDILGFPLRDATVSSRRAS